MSNEETIPETTDVPKLLGHPGKHLTEEDLKKLQSDKLLVSDFKCLKLEKEAKKNWDLFYKRNSTNFFKDRHWTTREFTELCQSSEVSSSGNLARCFQIFLH